MRLLIDVSVSFLKNIFERLRLSTFEETSYMAICR